MSDLVDDGYELEQLFDILANADSCAVDLLRGVLARRDRRIIQSERSLSALREAVGNVRVYLRSLCMGNERMDSDGELALLSDLDAAHDAAPVATTLLSTETMERVHKVLLREAGEAAGVPREPTLTLEEVQAATDELLERESAQVRPGIVVLCAELRNILAQKEAGRGR